MYIKEPGPLDRMRFTKPADRGSVKLNGTSKKESLSMPSLTERPGRKLRSKTTRSFVLSLSTVCRGDVCSLEGMGSCFNAVTERASIVFVVKRFGFIAPRFPCYLGQSTDVHLC